MSITSVVEAPYAIPKIEVHRPAMRNVFLRPNFFAAHVEKNHAGMPPKMPMVTKPVDCTTSKPFSIRIVVSHVVNP